MPETRLFNFVVQQDILWYNRKNGRTMEGNVMNDSLSELDRKEQEPAAPARDRGQRAPSARNRQPQIGLSALSLAVSIIALIVAGAALFLVLRGNQEPEVPPDAEEPITFRFGDMVLEPIDGMPLNPYDADAFALDEKGRVTYEANGRRAKAGIDVSTHQKEIDWPAVAADGIDFAIIRAGNRAWGTGVLMEDSKFVGNMEGAIAAGLDVGAYYFSNAITVAEAEEEAEAFLARLEPYKEHITYPVVCDWEYLGGNDSRAYGVDGRIITQCIDAFCKKVAEAGYTPMIYFNEYCGYIKMDLSKLTDYQFWFAQYSDAPSCFYDFQFWQYSSKGKVAGIGSAVDMNLCFVPYGKGLVDIPEPGPEETEPAESDPVETAPVETDPADPAPEDSGTEALGTVIIDAPPVPAVPPAR